MVPAASHPVVVFEYCEKRLLAGGGHAYYNDASVALQLLLRFPFVSAAGDEDCSLLSSFFCCRCCRPPFFFPATAAAAPAPPSRRRRAGGESSRSLVVVGLVGAHQM